MHFQVFTTHPAHTLVSVRLVRRSRSIGPSLLYAWPLLAPHTHTLRHPDLHKNVRTRTCYFCSIHWLAMDAERTMPPFAMQWRERDVTCAPTVLEREERCRRSSKPECQF